MTPLLDAAGPSNLYALLDRGGTLALLCVIIFVIIVGGMRGWYSFRWYIDELRAQNQALREANSKIREDLEGWRDIALQNTTTLSHHVRRQRGRQEAE